jgi:hypothetical protein
MIKNNFYTKVEINKLMLDMFKALSFLEKNNISHK